jgi:tripartite-type tricarboxylate transporter receptor subunit TctC
MRNELAVAFVILAGTLAAATQDWPTAPVKIIVPFAAGATPDIVARLIADRLHGALHRTFVVENRPGAAAIPERMRSPRRRPTAQPSA